jgi:hypothetical protein
LRLGREGEEDEASALFDGRLMVVADGV